MPTETVIPLPELDVSFAPDTITFLKDEDARRFNGTFNGFIHVGGTAPTSASLSHTIVAMDGIVHGYFVFQPDTLITYTANRRTYCFLDSVETRAPEIVFTGGAGATFKERSGNLVFAECDVDSTLPFPSVAGLQPLFYADTSGTAITAVFDLRNMASVFAYRPENFAGSDFGAKLQACINSMPDDGGTVDCRGFTGPVEWASTVTTDKTLTLLFGKVNFQVTATKCLSVTGTADLEVIGLLWLSKFNAMHNSMKVFEFLSNGHLYVSGIFGENGGITQVAGYLIDLSPPNGSTQHIIEKCTSGSLWKTITIGKANQVSIRDCDFTGGVSSEISGSYWGAGEFDAGTTYVTDCVFASGATTGTAIAWNDSSGLYVHNCHIIGYAIGIAALATQNHIYNEIMVYDCRIGIQAIAGIIIKRDSGSGGFAQCILSNNSIGSQATTYVIGVQLANILFSSVVGNRISAGGVSVTTMLGIDDASDVYIVANDFITAQPTNAAIGLNVGPYDNVRIGRNHFVGFNAHAAVSVPLIGGVFYEPEIKVGSVSVNPPSITANTQVPVDVTITGLRPGHGDRIYFERAGSMSAGLVFGGAIISSNDTARLFIANVTGSPIDDAAFLWTYTWIDQVP